VSAFCSKIDENIEKLSATGSTMTKLHNAKDTLDEKYTENHYCGNDENFFFNGDNVTNEISN